MGTIQALAEGKSWGCGGGEEGKGESYAGQGGAGKASNVTKFGPFWAPLSSNLWRQRVIFCQALAQSFSCDQKYPIIVQCEAPFSIVRFQQESQRRTQKRAGFKCDCNIPKNTDRPTS